MRTRVAVCVAVLLVFCAAPAGADGLTIGVGTPTKLMEQTPTDLAVIEHPRSVVVDPLTVLLLAATANATYYGHIRVGPGPVEFDWQTLALASPMTAFVLHGRTSSDGSKSILGACASNPCWLESDAEGNWTQRTAIGTYAAFFTELPRSARFFVRVEDDKTSGKLLGFDHPTLHSLFIYDQLRGGDPRLLHVVSDASTPFFYRWFYDLAVARGYLATLYRQRSGGAVGIDLRVMQTGAGGFVALDTIGATLPAAAYGQMKIIRIPDTLRFFAVWQGSDGLIRAAIVDAVTGQVWRYDLAAYSAAHGIAALTLFATNRGLLAMWIDRREFAVAAALLMYNGTIWSGFGSPIGVVSAGGLATVSAAYFYMFQTAFIGTQLSGQVFLAGNSLHVAPFTLTLQPERARGVRR